LSEFFSEKCGTNGILELLERMEHAEQMERDGTSEIKWNERNFGTNGIFGTIGTYGTCGTNGTRWNT
jgi:hypothetical protein